MKPEPPAPRRSNGLSIGQCATLACQLEVTIPKPGNVHRGADFEDLSLIELLVSAVAIGPAMDAAAGGARPGETILRAVEATRRFAPTNTNLGMVLLLAPLAAVPADEPLASGVRRVLQSLTDADARDVYQAIREAKPGGLGRVGTMDVAGPPPDSLLDAMRAAADRDLVARQYVSGFEDLFATCVPWLRSRLDSGCSLTDAVIHTHVRLMHRFPDSLIARKCGGEVAQRSAALAGAAVEAGKPGDPAYHDAVANLDFWLRSDGHRRNPGTTADFIAAGLFVLLRDGRLTGPFK